jgi:hypothetical protein
LIQYRRRETKRGTDAHQRPDVQVDQVENEDDDVDDKDDEVETAAVSDTALAEALLAAEPIATCGGAQERADDEADDDLQDLHDTVGASNVQRVETDVGHCKGRFGSDGVLSTS